MDLLVVGQALQGAVEHALALQRADHPLVNGQQFRRSRAGIAQGDVLVVVVAQHLRGDLVGHARQQGIALVHRQATGAHDRVEQDLDVHLVVRGVHARGVVDGVGVQAHAAPGGLDAAGLSEPEVAALPHDLTPKGIAVDAHAIVGTVAHVGIGLRGGLHIGADAAIEEQLHGRGEDRRDELVRGERGDVRTQVQHRGHLGSNGHGLGASVMHPATGGDKRRVVVGPRRSGQGEQPLPLDERPRRIGIGIKEHMPVVERRDQSDVRRQQHGIAEDVAAHVADAGDGEVLALGVDTQLAEVPLDRLPGAARRDPHRLVVVTVGAAGGERIVEPEVMLLGNRIGQVGERGRALVGGDDEVGIVTVASHDAGRRYHGTLDEIVGEVEHRRHELPVGRAALRLPRLAVGRIGKLAREEAALGAHGDDDRVLDLLRLDQAEDLGAEVLGPVGPAQAAAGDRAEAQVHALHPRGVHPDLEARTRQRHVGHRTRIELQGDPGCRAGECGRAQRGLDEGEE